METARLNSAGIRAPEGCLSTLLRRLVGHAKCKLGRFWGSCDDQLHCSYPNVDGSRCFPLIHGTLARSFSGHDGKHLNKSCSKWHVPPGLDPVLARSLTSDCDAFAVVREPMERMISEFNWLRMLRCSNAVKERIPWAHYVTDEQHSGFFAKHPRDELNRVLGTFFPHPIRFRQIWYVWQAVPPSADYVALGMLCTTVDEAPVMLWACGLPNF
eukprot:Skav234813  [mRNA]  locus=scaffold69:739677:747462:- [translate_table: standard]